MTRLDPKTDVTVKTLKEQVSERLHKKLDKIVDSGNERRLKLVNDFLDVMIDSS